MANRFRKVFIVCKDNQIFSELTNTTMYKYRDAADFACRRLQGIENQEREKLWNANKPKAKFKVHGFYLVHEDVFKD